MSLPRQRHIIVTGIPASGKSTIGRAVAGALGWPMFDKDEILETMFANRGVGDSEWRTQLSRAADEVLKERGLQSREAVITSWWRHPASFVNTGTPVEWLALLSGTNVELHCVCSPDIAAERFLTRQRHAGHLDNLKKRSDLLTSFQEQAALGPLGVGRVVKVNTEQSVEFDSLLAQINFVLEE